MTKNKAKPALKGSIWRWLGFGGATAATIGQQYAVPSAPLGDGPANVGTDGALQIATVWACVDRRATTIASLPFFAYLQDGKGEKTLARSTRLYTLLHESPNRRMTPFEF